MGSSRRTEARVAAAALAAALLGATCVAGELELDPAALLRRARENAGTESVRVQPARVAAGVPGGPRYTAPDSGPRKAAYVGSLHWFFTPDGRLICLDVIRSDDHGRMALRVFVAEKSGAVRGWVYEAPSSEWAPFATDRAAVRPGRNVLGRGDGWIAGSVRDAATGMDAAFDLDLVPTSPGLGAPAAALRLLEVTATDYPSLRVTGRLTLRGERLEIDSPGLASVHHGSRLPRAAWLGTPPGAAGTRLLAAAAGADNLRLGGRIMGGASLLYAYGSGALPAFSVHIGRFGEPVDLGRGVRLSLSNVRVVAHVLLGEPEATGLADAVLEKPASGILPGPRRRTERIPLGQVIVDYRGPEYIRALPK